MKPEVLLVCPLIQPVMEALERDYSLHRLWPAADRAAFLAEVGPSIRGIATSGHHGADREILAACPALEIVSSYGVGYDAVDIPYALERGVVVTHTPDVLNQEVSNLAVGLLLAVARRICEADRFVRDGCWLEGEMPLAASIHDKRLGVLGLGRIGKLVARKAEVLGCAVVYHGRRPQPDQPWPYYDDLTAMARDCDLLVIVTPGGADTHHLLDRAVIEALGPEGILVNVARGSVVEQEALVEALTSGRLGGAGLDVFAEEPRVPEALLALENVVLQPHRGSATRETRGAMGDLVLRNLEAHFAGRPALTPVPECKRAREEASE